MASVYLLLGGNKGNVLETFEKAYGLISDNIGNIKEFSPVYCSEPWGFESDNMFYNQVIHIETNMSPLNLLSAILKIEFALGRKRKKGIIESRIIDIDILFYNDSIIREKALEIPHPRMHLRRFALVPMAYLAPELKHPVLGESIKQILETCTDNHKVYRL